MIHPRERRNACPGDRPLGLLPPPGPAELGAVPALRSDRVPGVPDRGARRRALPRVRAGDRRRRVLASRGQRHPAGQGEAPPLARSRAHDALRRGRVGLRDRVADHPRRLRGPVPRGAADEQPALPVAGGHPGLRVAAVALRHRAALVLRRPGHLDPLRGAVRGVLLPHGSAARAHARAPPLRERVRGRLDHRDRRVDAVGASPPTASPRRCSGCSARSWCWCGAIRACAPRS